MFSLAFQPADEEDLAREEGWHRAAGIACQRLTALEVRKLEPRVSQAARSGLFYPEVFQVDTGRLVEAYLQVVQAQGARIRVNSPAKRFLLKEDQVVGVETAEGPLFADRVVNCAGPWAGFDAGLAFTIPAVPVRGQMIQFQTSPSFISHVCASPRAYLVQRAAGVLIAGTTVEYAGFDKRVTEEGLAAIRSGAQELAPGVGRLPVQKSWAGLRPGTPDGRPVLGPAPLKNLLLAYGHHRNGILLAPLTGRVAADWVTQAQDHPELAPFGVSRFLAKPDRVVVS